MGIKCYLWWYCIILNNSKGFLERILLVNRLFIVFTTLEIETFYNLNIVDTNVQQEKIRYRIENTSFLHRKRLLISPSTMPSKS